MTDITQSILAIKSDAQVSVDNDDINKITWYDGNPTNITNDQILAKQTELKTAYNNNKYQRDRAVAYKELKEQLDLLYHDMTADKGDKTGEWYKHIKAVKDANPKG
jgi:hypothetical protein|tara:strand:- start:91 stop:408 length:318 start_codon:yes stop_codon:yes gene_type:complete